MSLFRGEVVCQDGYKFSLAVEVPATAQPCTPGAAKLESYFEALGYVKCTVRPWTGQADWWAGWVQTIVRDDVTLRYGDGAQVELRTFGLRPKDQNLDIARFVDARISLFDIEAHACQRIPSTRTIGSQQMVADSLHRVTDKIREHDLPRPDGETAVVLFWDRPAVSIGSQARAR